MKPTDREKVCPDCGEKFVAHFAIKRKQRNNKKKIMQTLKEAKN